jgi:hypothetical protein
MLKRKKKKSSNQTGLPPRGESHLMGYIQRFIEESELRSEYLKAIDIWELTGYIRYSTQMTWLTANGIPFTLCADARVKVLKTDVYIRLGLV